MTALADACSDLAEALPYAAVLTAIPDTDGSHGRSGKPGSRPPWNPAAAGALYGGLAEVAATVTEFRFIVTGAAGPRPAASATGTALRAIERLSHGVPHDRVREAAHRLSRCVVEIGYLPGRDTDERPQRVPATCPYCGYGMLRVYPRSGQVTCTRAGDCFDSDGRHPAGVMEIGRLGAQVVWNDGLVAP